MNDGIDPAGKGWRGFEHFEIDPAGELNEDLDASPLRQSGSAFWDGLRRYKRSDISIKRGQHTGNDEPNAAPRGDSRFSLASGADIEQVAQGAATNESAGSTESPIPHSMSDERRALQRSAQAVPRIVESVDATLHETRSAYMRVQSEARVAARDLARAIDAFKKAEERLVNWYAEAVIEEVRGSFPREIGPIDEDFAERVTTWLREPSVASVTELADYEVGAAGEGAPFDRLMEDALDRVTSRENPEVARLHEAEDAAYAEQRRAETTFKVLDGQMSRLHKRVLALQDASAAAHLTNEAMTAAREADAVVADGEADTPASERARDLRRLAQDMLGHLNGMLGDINDEMRS